MKVVLVLLLVVHKALADCVDYSKEECEDFRKPCVYDAVEVGNETEPVCRDGNDMEVWMKVNSTCSSLTNIFSCRQRLYRKHCRWDWSSWACEPKKDKPETCETECGKCSSETTCQDQGCLWLSDESECLSCSDDCAACFDNATCSSSEADDSGCKWDLGLGGCRELTEMEEWVKADRLCRSFGYNFWQCREEKRVCKYSRHNGGCVPKAERPEICEPGNCDKCENNSTCNEAGGGCSWNDSESECTDCRNNCSCSTEDLCTTTEDCVFDEGACRDKTELEEWMDLNRTCSEHNFFECKHDKKRCKFDKHEWACIPRQKMPEVCEAGECDKCEDADSCSAAPGDHCSWADGECVDCNDRCSACTTQALCENSDEGCAFETSSGNSTSTCRDLTEWEEWYRDHRECQDVEEDWFGCRLLRKICRWKGRKCVTKEKEPKDCHNTCSECNGASACTGSAARCNWSELNGCEDPCPTRRQ